MKAKLIGSASTLEQLNKLINQYFYSTCKLVQLDPNELTWLVYNTQGRIEGCYIKKVKSRYRFEMVQS